MILSILQVLNELVCMGGHAIIHVLELTLGGFLRISFIEQWNIGTNLRLQQRNIFIFQFLCFFDFLNRFSEIIVAGF